MANLPSGLSVVPHAALRTALCDRVGIEAPVIQAGMGYAASPRLAAAVSNAGGLGVIGAARMTPEQIDEAIAEVRALTSRPFGVDTLLPAGNPQSVSKESLYASIPREYLKAVEEFRRAEGLPEAEPEVMGFFSQETIERQMEVIIGNRVPVYAAGLGNPARYIDALHAAGTCVLSIVGSVKAARTVVDGGADVVVAQGTEGGGHTGHVGSMSLTPAVARAVGGRALVVSAGGVSTGAALVATLALGATGAWMGTRFLVAEEANLQREQKTALFGRDPSDMVLTHYRTGKQARHVRTPLIQMFADSGLEPLPMPAMKFVADMLFDAAVQAERFDLATTFGGQGAFALEDVEPAAAIVSQVVAEANATLERLGSPNQSSENPYLQDWRDRRPGSSAPPRSSPQWSRHGLRSTMARTGMVPQLWTTHTSRARSVIFRNASAVVGAWPRVAITVKLDLHSPNPSTAGLDTPRLESVKRRRLADGSGRRFVVELAELEADVQDADPAVGWLPVVLGGGFCRGC
jgi:nitronate monooxygenase